MGFYQEQILPRFQDKVMGGKRNRPVRARVCEGLRGAVVEVGFGTGLNTWYYPPEVTKVVAIEPSQVFPAFISRAGFDIDTIDTYYFKGDPKPMGYTYEGRAVSR